MNDEIESHLNYVDLDTSFESCIDPDCQKIDELDDSSVESFHSCASTKTNSKIDGDKNESINGPVEPQEDEDDDDVGPSSCRDPPSSDKDAASCWSDENGDWICDAEVVAAKRSHGALVAPLAQSSPVYKYNTILYYCPRASSNQCNRTGYAHPNNRNNPTFHPTSSRFFMHDLRQNDEESAEKAQSSGDCRNSASSVATPTTHNVNGSRAAGCRRPRNNCRGGKENRFDSGCSDRWAHDLYDEAEQRPLSHSQLLDKYGDNRSPARYPRPSSYRR